jgi:hypothetical protein
MKGNGHCPLLPPPPPPAPYCSRATRHQSSRPPDPPTTINHSSLDTHPPRSRAPNAPPHLINHSHPTYQTRPGSGFPIHPPTPSTRHHHPLHTTHNPDHGHPHRGALARVVQATKRGHHEVPKDAAQQPARPPLPDVRACMHAPWGLFGCPGVWGFGLWLLLGG